MMTFLIRPYEGKPTAMSHSFVCVCVMRPVGVNFRAISETLHLCEKKKQKTDCCKTWTALNLWPFLLYNIELMNQRYPANTEHSWQGSFKVMNKVLPET